MSKATVTRLFAAAVVAVVVGFVIGLIAVIAALAGGAVTIGGPDFVRVDAEAFAGTIAWLAIASVLVTAGGVTGLVSWLGALLNTAQLDDKTWVVVLLVLGLFSFGWIAMIAYIIAGPDGSRPSGAPLEVATAAGD
jgi:hypothetical protein